LFVVLPDNDPDNVTLKVNGSDKYTYPSPTATEYQLHIIQNGNQDVTGSNVTAIVGQPINLTCEVEDANGHAPPAPWSITNYAWKVSSYAISNFYVSTDAWHTNGYATPLTKTTNSGINFYWVDGGSKQVQCAIKAAGQTLLAKAAFIVKKPSATLSAYIPPGSSVGVYQNQLIFGGGPVPGIEFFEYNEDTDGEWKLVQLGSQVVRDQDFPTNGGGWYKAQGSGLDTAYPYPIEEESDSPSTELTSYINQVTATGSYTMYLTFKANEANSIRIPIRQIQWNWSGTATNSNGVWMGSGTAHTDSNDSPVTGFTFLVQSMS
jgi:hypothetical protein